MDSKKPEHLAPITGLTSGIIAKALTKTGSSRRLQGCDKTPEQLLAELNSYGRSVSEEAANERGLHKQAVADANRQSMLSRAAIPKRFMGKSLDDLQARDDMHRKYISWMRRYVADFEEMRTIGRNAALIGKSGSGKTHMACGVANALLAQRYSVFFTSVSDFFSRLHASYGDEGGDAFVEKLARIDFLVMDEVGVYRQRDMDGMRSQLFHLLNRRYEECKPVFLLSNLSQSELIEYIGDRYSRRLMENGGQVFSFPWGAYEESKQ